MGTATPLTDALETALLRELQRTWHHLNRQLFDNAMRAPAFDLVDRARVLAAWRPSDRSLSFARRLIAEHPWTGVIEILKHEMAHQYATEVLGAGDEPAHGRAFREVCARHGIDARASGTPRGGEPDDTQRVVTRIQKLLALGSSANENEAQAAMKVAQRLMLEHNIAWAETERDDGYGFRQLGAPSLRIQSWERILAGILADHFFVEAIWVPAWLPRRGKRGKVLEVAGAPANLDIAEHVHQFASRTAKQLWKQFRAEHGKQPRGERTRFLVGAMLGLRDQLRAQADECRETGLVWVGDAGLDDYVARRHPVLRAGRRVRFLMTDAYRAGRDAGRRIQLRTPVEASRDGAVGKLERR